MVPASLRGCAELGMQAPLEQTSSPAQSAPLLQACRHQSSMQISESRHSVDCWQGPLASRQEGASRAQDTIASRYGGGLVMVHPPL